mmetsp:Transcript_11712/g.38488  ORF Transcript_11712/g.38488 Transcript_11712/m.38488 type:complete len:329 (+) Transcript_11712:546-1532(+)
MREWTGSTSTPAGSMMHAPARKHAAARRLSLMTSFDWKSSVLRVLSFSAACLSFLPSAMRSACFFFAAAAATAASLAAAALPAFASLEPSALVLCFRCERCSERWRSPSRLRERRRERERERERPRLRLRLRLAGLLLLRCFFGERERERVLRPLRCCCCSSCCCSRRASLCSFSLFGSFARAAAFSPPGSSALADDGASAGFPPPKRGMRPSALAAAGAGAGAGEGAAFVVGADGCDGEGASSSESDSSTSPSSSSMGSGTAGAAVTGAAGAAAGAVAGAAVAFCSPARRSAFPAEGLGLLLLFAFFVSSCCAASSSFLSSSSALSS